MLDDIIKERLKKLEALKASGLNPYPARVKRGVTLAEAVKKFATLSRTKKKIAVAGRVMGFRDQGNLLFLDISDATGALQAVVKKDSVSNFKLIKGTLDRGDFVAVTGILFKTKRGERSIEARTIDIITKSILPLPSEWYGVHETELRLRKRYLDLIMNPDVRKTFEKKSIFWASFRDYLRESGFLEVETPVLESVPGGAEAEPFKTHHNALDEDYFLRISLELPLKKLLVGGYEKVFEIGRVFRNEGIDREHLQDYTQLEFYWAYADYNELMKYVEKLFKYVISRTTGGLVTTYGGKKVNWGKKWKTVSYVELFKQATKLDPLTASAEALREYAKKAGLSPEAHAGKGKLIDLIFKKMVRGTLQEPCFLIDPPVDVEPLAKRSEHDSRVVERFQLVACGTELCKGFSELNDPIDQRKRFLDQMALREAGDTEAQRLDEDFVEALEYGMPPAAGIGVSERLFAVLMDKPVREMVIFPLMRREE
ncbi:MAG: lysine--tRNA ligase [bacterium]|nr:lysine--tRNA ligase [bacterium]